MTTKFIYIEIIVFIILLSLEWKHSNIRKTTICSKDKSRLVRKIILSKWIPILDKYNVKFPLECPFNFLRDYYFPAELNKNRLRPTQWTCNACGKNFFKEKFLDEHMERRHNYLKNWAEDSICLANYCDIMRCDVFETKESLIKVEKNEIITDIEVWEDISFQNSLIPSRNIKSSSAFEDKRRYSIMKTDHASRIPVTNEMPYHSRKLCLATINNNNINNVQNNNLDKKDTNFNSDNLENSKDEKTEDEDKSKASPIINNTNNNNNNNNNSKNNKINNKNINKNNNNSNSNKNNNNSKTINNDNITMQQKIRNNCKSEELDVLKQKCQSLVRSCTIGLLLQMSDFSYKAMEDELNNAVCWYLTCDRYWEDGPMSVQTLPWILVIIVIIIFSIGICFCYYIIWILFDLDEKDNYNNLRTNKYNEYYTNNYNNDNHQYLIDSSASYLNDENSLNRMSGIESRNLPSSTTNNDHYIYVTYPTDLKKRIHDKY